MASDSSVGWQPRTDLRYEGLVRKLPSIRTSDHPLIERTKVVTDGPILTVTEGGGPSTAASAGAGAGAGAGTGSGSGSGAGAGAGVGMPPPPAPSSVVITNTTGELDPLSAMLLADGGGGGGGASAVSTTSHPLDGATTSAAGATTASSSSSTTTTTTTTKTTVVMGSAARLHTDEAWAEARKISENWTQHKASVLREFSVSGTVNVTTEFMSNVDTLPSENDGSKKKVEMSKARARLEHLERAALGSSNATVEISLKEYLDHIKKLQHDMQVAWMRAERVKSLKIAIQCAKLLNHMNVPHFYPTIFCYITGILDAFGQLVFERIRVRAEEVDSRLGGSQPLPEDFTCNDIGDEAKETCKNWIYKTSCIRELLPRLFVEICLLQCYRFITPEAALPAIVQRLSDMIRGIGDSVVAVYARTYLSMMASQVIHGAKNRSAVQAGVKDFLFSFKDAVSPAREAWIHSKGLTQPIYLNLMSPAVGWLMSMAGDGAKKDEFTGLMAAYKEHCGSSMVLRHVLEGFDPSFYSPHTTTVVSLVKGAAPSLTTPARLYASLAKGLAASPPPERMRLPFLNESWKTVTKVEDPVEYTACAAVFMQLLVVAYSERELLILLRDLVKHLKRAAKSTSMGAGAGGGGGGAVGGDALDDGHLAGHVPDAVLPHLEKILTTLVSRETDDLGGVVTSDEFITLFDLFHGDRKTAFCKTLLKSFVERSGTTNDAALIHTMFDVGKALHDSLDSLSVEDERLQVSELLCRFLDKIDFGRDVEGHLNVLVDCRASFANLDSVKDALVLAALKLASKALRLIKGRHTKKTSAFVKGCFAFCHITIPSIDDVLKRLALFKLAGEVALINHCLPQTDTFFKAVIQELPEVPEYFEVGYSRIPTEPRLVEFLRSFLSSIIVMPGHPQYGPFYLVKGLMTALERYPWPALSRGRTQVMMSLIPVLAAYGQTSLPLHVPGVESNDVLYAGDPEYTSELNTTLNDLMSSIFQQVADVGKVEDPAATGVQTNLVLELIVQVLNYVKLNDTTTPLVAQLFDIARKNDAASPRLAGLVGLVERRAAVNQWLAPLVEAVAGGDL